MCHLSTKLFFTSGRRENGDIKEHTYVHEKRVRKKCAAASQEIILHPPGWENRHSCSVGVDPCQGDTEEDHMPQISWSGCQTVPIV